MHPVNNFCVDSNIVFGANEYKKYFDWIVEEINLPENIDIEMNRLFKFCIENDVKSHPIAVLIDPRLTLKNIGELSRKYFTQSRSGYASLYPGILEPKDQTDSSYQKPYWILSMDGVMGTGLSWSKQEDIIKKYNLKEKSSYMAPTVKEAVTVIYAKCIFSESCEVSQTPTTFTLTQNKLTKDQHIIVGGLWANIGLSIHASTYDNKVIGISPLQRFI